jgi:hypothetical protein
MTLACLFLETSRSLATPKVSSIRNPVKVIPTYWKLSTTTKPENMFWVRVTVEVCEAREPSTIEIQHKKRNSFVSAMRLQKTQVANPKTVLGEHAEFRYNIS